MGESVDVYVTELKELLLRRHEKGDLGVISLLNLDPPKTLFPDLKATQTAIETALCPGDFSESVTTPYPLPTKLSTSRKPMTVLKISTLPRCQRQTRESQPIPIKEPIEKTRIYANVGLLITLPPRMKKRD